MVTIVILLVCAYGLFHLVSPPVDWYQRSYPHQQITPGELRVAGVMMMIMGAAALITSYLPGGVNNP